MALTVADIYSQANRLKRRVQDFASNPLESLLQTASYGQQRMGEFRQLNEIALQGDLARAKGMQPTPEQVAAENKVRDIWASAYNPTGITVYHGSPYLFRQFNPAKMGTGEGAQSYGAGAGYTAEARPVAEEYAKANIGRAAALSGEIDKFPKPIQMEVYKAMQMKDGFVKNAQIKDIVSRYPETQKLFGESKSYLYEGDIPDELLPKFLDWDKPLSQQAPEAQALAKQYGLDLEDLGGDLVAKVGKNLKGSEILEKAGLKGIQYFDANSRNAQYKSQNFIPFRPEDFQIKKINDIPLQEWEAKGAF